MALKSQVTSGRLHSQGEVDKLLSKERIRTLLDKHNIKHGLEVDHAQIEGFLAEFEA